MLVYVCNIKNKIYCDFEDFTDFPFDILYFKYKFAFSELKFQNKFYRFDFYRTKEQMIYFK